MSYKNYNGERIAAKRHPGELALNKQVANFLDPVIKLEGHSAMEPQPNFNPEQTAETQRSGAAAKLQPRANRRDAKSAEKQNPALFSALFAPLR